MTLKNIKKIRVVMVVPWHSEKMGYSDNFLPKFLSKLGFDVHLITGNAQVYFNHRDYKETLESVLGPKKTDCGVKKVDGYTVHRLPLVSIGRSFYIKGLIKKIKDLSPNVVQSGEFKILTTYQIAIAKIRYGFKFYIENHTHLSVFNKKGLIRSIKFSLYSWTIGKVLNKVADLVFPISSDAAFITNNFFGISKDKIEIISLGTDSSLFFPLELSSPDVIRKRNKFRSEMGFSENDIVCIYTGRIIKGKSPIILANAIQILNEDPTLSVKGFFIGSGDSEYIKKINNIPGCLVHDFVPTQELPVFYQMSDIAVWPKQESTSQLDAMSCGLPIILSDKVQIIERIEGNGCTYKESDSHDLARVIKSIASSDIRSKMRSISISKVQRQFDWEIIAKKYSKHYL